MLDQYLNGEASQSPEANPAPPITDREAINRANAQNSTGPRTAAGKLRSSMNALRHGLTGHTIVLPSEDLAAYERHVQNFFDDLQPKGAIEKQLVQDIADTTWRLNRIPALETNLLSLGITEHTGAIDCNHPQAQDALATAAAFRANAKEFASLSTHGQRLSRQFHKTLSELREIQAERRLLERRELDRAADLVQLHQKQNLTYQPADDGFVFSNDEIQTYIRRRARDQRAYGASHPFLRAGS